MGLVYNTKNGTYEYELGNKALQKPTDFQKKKSKKNNAKAPISKKQENTNYFNDGYDFGDITKTGIQLGKNLVKTPENFKDGYDFGDITKTIGASALDIGAGTIKGMMNFGESAIADPLQYGVAQVSDWMGFDNFANAVRENAKQNGVEQTFAPIDKLTDRYTAIGTTGDQLSSGIGNVIAMGNASGLLKAKGLPSSVNVGKFAIPTTSIASGIGSGMTEAYNNGASDGEAWTYGALSGLAEGFSESLFGGLGKKFNLNVGEGGLDDFLVKKFTDKISNNTIKILAESGLKATGEGVEEILSGIGSAVSKKLTYLSEKDLETLIKDENLAEQFIMGTLTSLISQTPGTIQSVKTGTDLITGQPTNNQPLTLENMQQNVPYTVKSNKGNINPSRTNNALNTPVLSENKQYAPYVPIKGKETENKKSSLVDQVEKQGEDIMKQEMQNYESITNDFKDYLIEEELDINEITDDNIDDFITNMYGDYEAYDNYNTEENVKGIGLKQKDFNKAKEIIESYVNENKIRKEEVEKNDYELWQDELNEILEKAKSVDEKFYNDMKKQSAEYRDRHRLEYKIYEETQSRQAGNEVNDDFFKEHFSDYDGQSGTKLADGIMTSVKLKKGNNLAKLSFTEGEDVIWIDELYVKNKNQGYGTEIVEAIKKYANENGKYVKAHKELSTAKGFWDKTLRNDKNSNNDIRHNAEFDEFKKNNNLNKEHEISETTNNPANNVMTMSEVKNMIDRVFNANGIYDFYDGKYSNADEWIKGEGIDDVSFYVENTEAIYDKFLSKLDGLYEDYTIEDILQAYVDGTLKTEKKAYQPKRLDLSKEQEIKDNRFYAPRVATNDDKLYSKALERVTNTNRQEVYKARADFIINAHEIGYLDRVGVTAKQFIEKSKSWANYNKKAMDLSNSLNEGVASQNKWTGIENSSIVNTLSITDEQLNKMIKEIKGESQDYQRKYIVSTMLALDTHIDYKNLTFEFNKSKEINQNTESGKRILGLYDNTIDTIKIGDGYQNTVAHEMGHYLDRQWGRELFGQNIELSEKRIISSKLDSLNPEQRQFVENFKGFIDDLENNSDIRNKYTMSSNEVFARFVARFVEWTKNQATNNRYGYENKYYEDNFTERQYKEFVKLLQEKSYLDTTGQTFTNVEFSKDVSSNTNYFFVGIENGIEIYETSKKTKKLSYSERKKELLKTMKEQYAGRTAKFKKNGKTYYAFYSKEDLNKGVYGDKKSDKKGLKAKINIGADGNYIELVENALYNSTSKETGKQKKSHENVKSWDYFVKTIKSDGNYFDVLINVRNTDNNQYVYDITLKKADSLPEQLSSYDGSSSALNNSISNNDAFVKSSTYEHIKNDTKFSIEETTNDKIQGLEDYTKPEIKNITTDYIRTALEYADVQADIVGMEIVGSRNRGTARPDSDLDIVVELTGEDLREDDLFNLLNDTDEPLEINGIKVDINPVIAERSGTLEEFMERSNDYDKEHTKYSASEDNKGRKLTKEQQEFFKNSKARDENGNLLTMYHGTNSDFNIFKRGKKGYLGGGIYLTDSKNFAEKYTDYGMVKEVYLDVKQPLTVTSNNPTKEILNVIYGSDRIYNNRSSKQANDTYIITKKDLDKLQSQGYDGIIWKFPSGNEYMVFNSNQVKNVDNTNPTDNPDIRYSIEENTTDNKGYHWGDLGKGRDTYHWNMTSSRRSTGHFGTGTYFLGSKDGNIGSTKNGRPLHEVDFSKYNLFKPENENEAYTLHKGLKALNYINNFNSDDFESLQLMLEKHGITGQKSYEAFVKARELYFSDEYQNASYDSELDSISTYFMKELGFNGIDVRGIEGFDNGTYGSVIYDLDNTVAKSDGSFTKFIDKSLDNKNVAVDSLSNPIELGTMKSLKGEKLKLSSQEYNSGYGFIRKITAEKENGEKAILSFKKLGTNTEEFDHKNDEYIKKYHTYEIKHLEGAEEGDTTGTTLLNELIKEAKENGISKIVAYDTTHTLRNRPSKTYWEKQGFKSNGEGDHVLYLDDNTSEYSGDIRYSIEENDSLINAPKQDNKGRKLTKKQQEFYKNEDKKLLDENGNLKTLYHGTPYNNFTTFKGKLFCFSEDYKFAKEYGETKSFDQGLDADVEVKEVYVKAENIFDPSNPEHIKKLSDNLSDNINYWGNIWDKETLLNKLQRKDTLPPKWKPEQIENKKFGDYIGDDRHGYNNDMFVGVNDNNEIVYISQERELNKLSQTEKDMFQKQLLDGKEVIYTTYQTIFGDLTEKGIHNKINELQKQSEEYKKENGFENEAIDYYIKNLKENLEWIKKDIFPSNNHKLIPRVATQESTELTDIDNWTYFETAMDNETRKDIVEIIQELGFDGVNMYEDGVSNFAVFKPNQIKNVDNLNPSDSDDIRYSMVEDPIEISKLKKEDASTTPIAPFVKTEGGKEDGRSKHYSNLTKKSKFLNDKSVAAISNENGVKYYDKTTNQETLEKAKKELDNGGKSETLKWFNKDPKNADPTDIAKGWILLKQYQDKGDYDSVVQVAKKMRMMGTTTGKTLQMYAIMERLTPEGMVNYAQSELSEAYELMIKNKSKAWIDKHKSDFDLSPSEVKFIMDTMQEVSKMQDGYEKDVKLAEIQKLMTDKLPPEKGAGIKAWMRISMLFNPKTQVRNVLGNAVIAPVNAVGDAFASGIDKMIAKKTGVRTTGNVNLSSYNEGFKKGLYKSYNDFKKGINTRNIEGNRFEIGQGKSFNDKTLIGHKLNQIDNLLSFMLDAGDRGFYEATFNNSINNQLILNNTTKVTPEMIDIATTEALQRTWQDNNEYTKFVLNTRKGLNKLMSIGGYGLGDILIPFAKTPANLTKAIIDYSPVGLVHSLVEGHNLKNAIETGQFTAQQQHKFVQDLGKAVAGTMLYVIGYALAKADIISGENDEDKDTANFMKNTLGISPYSIKIGNKSFTYDWAQPVAAPFAIMSDFMSSNDEDASILEKSISAFNTGFNIVVEQSFMQSIKTVLDNKDGIATGIQEAIMELPSRAIPTLSKQIVDLTDGTQRQTFVYGKPLETAKNKVLAKIPGASKALAPTVDTMGREIKKYGGKNNIFNVFFNPASVNNENISESAGEIYRLYQETGRTDLMPRVSPYYINHKGEKIVLSNEDKSRFQKISGDIIEQNVQKIMNSSQYQYLSDEEKADIIQDIVNYSYNKARFDVLGIEMSDTYQSVSDYEDIGGNISDYYLFQNNIDNTNKKESISNYLINSNLSDKEISYLYNKYYSSDETMNLLSKFNIPVKEYIKFNLQSFESDYNNKGRAISGSKQAKVFNYINSLKLSTTQKAILMKMQYKSFKKYDRQILSYINKMNATRFEKASYAKQIGFDYYDDYLINYILKQNASNEEKIKQLKNLGFRYINGKIYK